MTLPPGGALGSSPSSRRRRDPLHECSGRFAEHHRKAPAGRRPAPAVAWCGRRAEDTGGRLRAERFGQASGCSSPRTRRAPRARNGCRTGRAEASLGLSCGRPCDRFAIVRTPRTRRSPEVSHRSGQRTLQRIPCRATALCRAFPMAHLSASSGAPRTRTWNRRFWRPMTTVSVRPVPFPASTPDPREPERVRVRPVCQRRRGQLLRREERA